MEVSAVLIGIGIYLGAGIIALGVLDLLTRRIRTKVQSATIETRDKLAASGTLVGKKESLLLFIGALWLFWPLVIFSALSSMSGGKNGQAK